MECTKGVLNSVVGVDVCFPGKKANPHIGVCPSTFWEKERPEDIEEPVFHFGFWLGKSNEGGTTVLAGKMRVLYWNHTGLCGDLGIRSEKWEGDV
jgi:hypothetical protein